MLQAWIFEAIRGLTSAWVVKTKKKIPRIVQWKPMASSKINFAEVYSSLNKNSHLVSNIIGRRIILLLTLLNSSSLHLLKILGWIHGKGTYYKPLSQMQKIIAKHIGRLWRITCHVFKAGSIMSVSYNYYYLFNKKFWLIITHFKCYFLHHQPSINVPPITRQIEEHDDI